MVKTHILPSLALAVLSGMVSPVLGQNASTGPSVYVVKASINQQSSSYDGVVEAVRQTHLAAQVSGAVIALDVKVGDKVKGGQVLMRLDARAAEQSTAASQAQAQALRAQMDLAKKEFERQAALHKNGFISQAALQQYEMQFKASTAQLQAQLAQTDAARTQSGFYVLRAPYAGIISEVPVALGDMAAPGRALVSIYDPSALRVSVAVPQTAKLTAMASFQVELEPPTAIGKTQMVKPTNVQVLPTVDAASHSQTIRLEMPQKLDIRPGTFARVWVNRSSAANISVADRIEVPTNAIVRRAELTGLYVLDSKNHALLRQVRLGSTHGDQVEVLTGLNVGERVLLNPRTDAYGVKP